QGCEGIVRRRAAATRTGGHEDGAGQYGRRFEQKFFPSEVARMLHSIEQRIKRDLASDVAAIAALDVDLVWVPLAKDMIGPAIGRMTMIIGTGVNGQFI